MSLNDISSDMGGDSSPSNTATSLPVAQVKTEAQYLEALRAMQSNFVFLFGDSQSGKTAICTSLIYHLMTNPDVGMLEERSMQGHTGQAFLRDSIGAISSKRFLPRSPLDTVTLSGGRFTPKDTKFSSVPLTFMEMSGERQRGLVAPTGSPGFPTNIDIFFQDPQLNLVFVVVVNHEDVTHEKDLLVADFLDFIRSKDKRFKKSRVLLIVSKWDTYTGDHSVTQLVKNMMPLSYAALADSKNAITTYTVGKVTTVGGQPYIADLNIESPRKLMGWLYQDIKGQDLFKENFWKRISNLIH
jgi:hypothetical protein